MNEGRMTDTLGMPARKKVVAVIGASSGIGRSVALNRARVGDDLILVARRQPLLEELAREIMSERGSEASQRDRRVDSSAPTLVVGDIRAAETTLHLVEQASSRHGRLDVVVYAAGWNVPQRAIGEATLESWQQIVDTNMTGAFLVTSAAVPLMRRQGDGLLIFISSSGAKRPDRSGAAYQASKAGLAGLAHATMEESRDVGVRTTVIYPGLTDTPFLEHRPTPTDPETLRQALQADDVATAVSFVVELPARAHVPELLLYPALTNAPRGL
jgi:NADP-dependent 3-hydroxy acid dehydrogenase YdfG